MENGVQVRNKEKEWAVSYHGTPEVFATLICAGGYDSNRGKNFAYGRGIYSTPDPKIAAIYAKKFTHDGKTYKVLMQNRVNMEKSRIKDVKGSVTRHGQTHKVS